MTAAAAGFTGGEGVTPAGAQPVTLAPSPQLENTVDGAKSQLKVPAAPEIQVKVDGVSSSSHSLSSEGGNDFKIKKEAGIVGDQLRHSKQLQFEGDGLDSENMERLEEYIREQIA